MNATLATLETEEEIIWMHGYRSYHENLRTNTWAGGIKIEGNWFWQIAGENKPIEFFDWAESQPDNFAGAQNCLALFGEFTRDEIPVARTWFRFDDDSCDAKNNYVCERSNSGVLL